MTFLQPAQARVLAELYGTPCYVYDQETLETQADAMLNFPNAFGLSVRFAMKACPNATMLKIFARKGLYFDASSGFEAHRAMAAGIAPSRISLSSQEIPADFATLLALGVSINACSLHQLELVNQRSFKYYRSSEVL